jgi:AcrR family transcriptional regulator
MKIEERRRPYRMDARARSAAATGERILDSAVAVFWERPVSEIPLDEVACRAGVSVQTVIRRFGGKDALFEAAMQREFERVRRQREAARPGDVRGAVRDLIDHYEDIGDGVLRMLAEEDRTPGVRQIADTGRAYHRDWCARVFGPTLDGLKRAERKRRLAQLIAVTDVLTWKLLRRDAALSRAQTELAVNELLQPLAGGR